MFASESKQNRIGIEDIYTKYIVNNQHRRTDVKQEKRYFIIIIVYKKILIFQNIDVIGQANTQKSFISAVG